ncbi:MAG TPA: hypothetical protein VLS92_06005 [Acidimicrobiia bacterium]|nr:hypothetical protein [Acidimicrobiia bacterium]
MSHPPSTVPGGPGIRPGLARRTARAALVKADAVFSQKGPAFKQLAVSWSANVAGDTLVTVALAGTLFFDVPSAQARDKVALYLLLAIAPFTIVAPVLGAVFGRHPAAFRAVLTAASSLRSVVAVVMAFGLTTLWLFPLALTQLVLSRLYGISKSSMLPVALPEPVALVSANALLARLGIYAGAAAALIGAGLVQLHSAVALVVAALFYLFSAFTGLGLPNPHSAPAVPAPAPAVAPSQDAFRQSVRSLRLSRLATAVVRLLNGFLIALLAFEFKDTGGIMDFGALIGAAGVGFALASFVSPWLERHLREEPMVVAALAVEAAAAFIAGQFFSLWAAALLAGAAGLASGTAKFAFDALLQSRVHPDGRGAAFTRSETLFQLAWVLGAMLPVVISVPAEVGLAVAGVAALAAQTVFISRLLGEPRSR